MRESKFATDRKSTRLNSSHLGISYAVFCLKKTPILNVDADWRGSHIPAPQPHVLAPAPLSKGVKCARSAVLENIPPMFLIIFFFLFQEAKQLLPPLFPHAHPPVP